MNEIQKSITKSSWTTHRSAMSSLQGRTARRRWSPRRHKLRIRNDYRSRSCSRYSKAVRSRRVEYSNHNLNRRISTSKEAS